MLELMQKVEVIGHRDRTAFAPRITVSLAGGTEYQGEYQGNELEWNLATEMRRVRPLFDDLPWPRENLESMAQIVAGLEIEQRMDHPGCPMRPGGVMLWRTSAKVPSPSMGEGWDGGVGIYRLVDPIKPSRPDCSPGRRPPLPGGGLPAAGRLLLAPGRGRTASPGRPGAQRADGQFRPGPGEQPPGLRPGQPGQPTGGRATGPGNGPLHPAGANHSRGSGNGYRCLPALAPGRQQPGRLRNPHRL